MFAAPKNYICMWIASVVDGSRIFAQSQCEVFQQFCILCGCMIEVMSVVPHGILAAKKVRQNEEKLKNDYRNYNMDLSPANYNSKFMNSIWGMYNRYSVHNFKKNMDVNMTMCDGQQQKDVAVTSSSAEKTSADSLKGSKGSLSLSAQNLWAFS